MKEDKKPRDADYLPHGFWEFFYAHENLHYKGRFVHGKKVGFHLWHYENKTPNYKAYYI